MPTNCLSVCLTVLWDCNSILSNSIPGLIPKPEKMVIALIFTTDIHVGPNKKTLGFSPNKIYF